MATHRERCKSLFRERVLPSFPRAKERFERHFIDSCGLLKLMPQPPAGAHISFHPDSKTGRLSPLDRVDTFDMDLSLTVLGIKPLYLSDSVEAANELIISLVNNPRWVEAFHYIHLEILQVKNGIFIYDPERVAPILSELLNREVRPEESRSALKEYNRMEKRYFSSELLGYPQMLIKGRTRGRFCLSNEGFVSPYVYYKSAHSSALHTPEALLNDRDGWAAAAAIIEEIRESPITIASAAVLEYNGDGFLHRDTLMIERTCIAGEWDVSHSNESRRITPLAHDSHFN